jgi:hypothetical protein
VTSSRGHNRRTDITNAGCTDKDAQCSELSAGSVRGDVSTSTNTLEASLCSLTRAMMALLGRDQAFDLQRGVFLLPAAYSMLAACPTLPEMKMPRKLPSSARAASGHSRQSLREYACWENCRLGIYSFARYLWRVRVPWCIGVGTVGLIQIQRQGLRGSRVTCKDATATGNKQLHPASWHHELPTSLLKRC